jgi:FAD/FMN-containing dehydrogenase
VSSYKSHADAVRHSDFYIERLEAENQQLRDALERRDSILSDWFAHYPEAVFLPLSPEQIAKAVDAITETGITSDALHAAWARHLLSTIMAKIKESDAALAAVRVEERP